MGRRHIVAPPKLPSSFLSNISLFYSSIKILNNYDPEISEAIAMADENDKFPLHTAARERRGTNYVDYHFFNCLLTSLTVAVAEGLLKVQAAGYH